MLLKIDISNSVILTNFFANKHLCVHVSTHTCMYEWRTEVNIGCLPQSLTTFFFLKALKLLKKI